MLTCTSVGKTKSRSRTIVRERLNDDGDDESNYINYSLFWTQFLSQLDQKRA